MKGISGNVKTQIHLIKIAEKHNLDIDDVQELLHYKELGFDNEYQKLLKKLKKT
jgi:hypothetical protein